ncbi:hypothetical protein D3C71_1653750 [compost metagenome]
MTLSPSDPRMEAAIIGSTAFFAPLIFTLPASFRPPRTIILLIMVPPRTYFKRQVCTFPKFIIWSRIDTTVFFWQSEKPYIEFEASSVFHSVLLSIVDNKLLHYSRN